MKRFFLLCLVLFAVGCGTTRLPSYVFSAPLPRSEEWRQVYPASRDRSVLKFFLVNDVTGARIDFFSHPSLYRSPSSVAGELKVRFAQAGYDPSAIEEATSATPVARFSIRHANGDRGEVVAFRPAGLRDCIVAIGSWPVASDARARADMDAIIVRIDVTPED